MIQSFGDQGIRDVFDGVRSKKAGKTCPPNLWAVARRKIDQVNQADLLEDLKVPPNNRLELLKGDRKGQHSIRINDQYRVCFRWTASGPTNVEIVDYH